MKYKKIIRDIPLKNEISESLETVVDVLKLSALDIKNKGLTIQNIVKGEIKEDKNPAVDVFFQALKELKDINDKYSTDIELDCEIKEKKVIDDLSDYYKKILTKNN